jgi:hypothetical protein
MEEAEYKGVSVLILVRECLEAFRIRNKAAKAATVQKTEDGAESETGTELPSDHDRSTQK